jgi:hypothetical protein
MQKMSMQCTTRVCTFLLQLPASSNCSTEHHQPRQPARLDPRSWPILLYKSRSESFGDSQDSKTQSSPRPSWHRQVKNGSPHSIPSSGFVHLSWVWLEWNHPLPIQSPGKLAIISGSHPHPRTSWFPYCQCRCIHGQSSCCNRGTTHIQPEKLPRSRCQQINSRAPSSSTARQSSACTLGGPATASPISSSPILRHRQQLATSPPLLAGT